MKNTVLPILFILIINLSISAQVETDTVFVSTTNTAYLVFPIEVDIIEISNPSQYVADSDGKTVFIKAKVVNAVGSKFMIKSGENYYLGYLMYKVSPGKIFYDYRNIEIKVTTTTTVNATVNPNRAEPLDTLKMQLKNDLISFKAASVNKYKTVGAFENNIYFALSDLRHNSKASFLKLKLSNQSSVSFLVDYVTFEIYENKTVSRNEITIILEDCPRQVAGKEEGYMYFALPLLSIPENCELKVTLRERNGLRTISFYIPSKIISSSATF